MEDRAPVPVIMLQRTCINYLHILSEESPWLDTISTLAPSCYALAFFLLIKNITTPAPIMTAYPMRLKASGNSPRKSIPKRAANSMLV